MVRRLASDAGLCSVVVVVVVVAVVVVGVVACPQSMLVVVPARRASERLQLKERLGL